MRRTPGRADIGARAAPTRPFRRAPAGPQPDPRPQSVGIGRASELGANKRQKGLQIWKDMGEGGGARLNVDGTGSYQTLISGPYISYFQLRE